jgi:glycosyltransferase involved in cell wall biosynthesis
MSKKILVAVPAYNCENQITRVMGQFKKFSIKFNADMVVIDNKSKDKTLEMAINFAQNNTDLGITVIQNQNNYGLGGSHKIAFEYALNHNYDGVVILHGDDQGILQDISNSLSLNLSQNNVCILGSRFMKGSITTGYSRFRIFGNKIFNKIYSMVTSQNIYDMGSGLNYYPGHLLNYRFHLKMPDDLTFNNAYLLAILCGGTKIEFIPIAWRESDQVSNVKFIPQCIKTLIYLFKYRISKSNFLQQYFGPKIEVEYNYSILQSPDSKQNTFCSISINYKATI